MSIPTDFTADERGGGWQTLLELFGEAPVPEKEQWKLAAMYNRLKDENAALKNRKRELSTNLKALQDHVGRCGKLLGCDGIDTDVEKAIAALKAQVARQSAPVSDEEWSEPIAMGDDEDDLQKMYRIAFNVLIARRAGGE